MFRVIVAFYLLVLVHVKAVAPRKVKTLDAGAQQAPVIIPAVYDKANGAILIHLTIAGNGIASTTLQVQVDTGSDAFLVPVKLASNLTPTAFVACGCTSGPCKAITSNFGVQCFADCSSTSVCQVGDAFQHQAQVFMATATIGGVSNQVPIFQEVANNPFVSYDGILGWGPFNNFTNLLFGSNSIGFCVDSNGDTGKIVAGNPGACSSSITWTPMFQAPNLGNYMDGFMVTAVQVCVLSQCASIPTPTFVFPTASLPSAQARTQAHPSSGWVAFADSGQHTLDIPIESIADVQNAINQVCGADQVCASIFPNPMFNAGVSCLPHNLTATQFSHLPVFSFTVFNAPSFQLRITDYVVPGACSGTAAYYLDKSKDNTWGLNNALHTSVYTVYDSDNGRVGFLPKSSGTSCGSC